jgi:NAD(P)-dependent dehydrogenase (short-subunit alcohol dehydrogenase family)
MSRFNSKVALVTGAAGDIGSATAKRLADDGARIAMTDIDGEKLQRRVDTLKADGVDAAGFVCDVTDYSAVCRMRDEVAAAFGGIHLLFNNAGYQGLFTQADRYPVDDWGRVIDVNVTGVFHVLRAVSETMGAAEGGAIVNTASMAGVAVPPNMPAYATSKAAVIGLTSAASLDLAPRKIRVNAISPAFMGPGMMWDRQVKLQSQADSQYYSSDPALVEQEMITAVPMRRVGSMQEIASVVSFLLSDDASYLTGINIYISGGIR